MIEKWKIPVRPVTGRRPRTVYVYLPDQAQEDEDPSRLVTEWNEETAKRELSLAGGASSFRQETKDAPGGYAGNSYYQRHLLMLRAAERGHGLLWLGAHGQ